MIAGAAGWVQALVLGIVQGLTEFIPVSSSGHLVLVPALAGWERHGLAFDVALHLGTLAALLAYYRADLWRMARALVSSTPSADRDHQRRMIVLLGVASLPVAAAGLLLDDLVSAAFGDPGFASLALLLTAAVLVAGEWAHRRRGVTADAGGVADTDPGIRLGQALTVGVAQAFALLPGLSRSGLTISAGIAAGLTRPEATRFAFLLGIPAIAGAALVELPALVDRGDLPLGELAIGIAAAAVAGYLAIAVLVRLVERIGVDRFAWYLVPAAVGSYLLVG